MMEEERFTNSAEEEFKLGGDENRDEGKNRDDDDPLPPLVEVFNIPELLQQILIKVDDVTDMKSLRLVSKQWRDLSLDRWRKTAVFSLTTQDAQHALNLTLYVDESLHSSLPPTLTIYRFHDKPFRQYRLKEGLIFPPELPSLENKLYFWEKCGPSITYLGAPECYFKKGLYFEGLYWILSSCPNLEELNFAPYEYTAGSDENENGGWDEYDDDDEDDDEELNVIYRIPKNENEGACVGGVNQAAGDKLKSLTLSYSNDSVTNQLFTNVKLATAFFGLIPNLSTLSIKNVDGINSITYALYQHAMESSQELQPFIHLKKFSAIRVEPTTIVFSELTNYLTIYSPELKTFRFHKLTFSELLDDPSQLRKTLKAIKDHVEEIDLSLECDDDDWPERWNARVLKPLKPNSCFDLFNLRFPQLTKLTLVFEYSSDDYAKFLSFDFGMLRGTPNLKYFHFGTYKHYDYFVVEKLKPRDLVKWNKEQSWHRVDGEERRSLEDIEDLIEVEDEEFLPHEEIVLEKMEEFHYEGAFNAEALRLWGNAMKNLKVLETVLDEKTFPVPFQVWGRKNLRKVKAYVLNEGALEESVIAEQQEKYPKVEIVKVDVPENSGWVSLSSNELKALPIRPPIETSDSDSYSNDDDDDSDAGSGVSNDYDSSKSDPPGSDHRSISGSESDSY